MGDEGTAETAEVGVGHVVGHGEHAHPRLPPHLQIHTGEPTVEVRFMSLDPIHGNPNQDREMRPGGGGWVGVEDDDAAGLLDARVSRGEVD